MTPLAREHPRDGCLTFEARMRDITSARLEAALVLWRTHGPRLAVGERTPHQRSAAPQSLRGRGRRGLGRCGARVEHALAQVQPRGWRRYSGAARRAVRGRAMAGPRPRRDLRAPRLRESSPHGVRQISGATSQRPDQLRLSVATTARRRRARRGRSPAAHHSCPAYLRTNHHRLGGVRATQCQGGPDSTAGGGRRRRRRDL
jgi:hypothetical protein